MYYLTFSKLAAHRYIEEKGYIKIHHIFLLNRATQCCHVSLVTGNLGLVTLVPSILYYGPGNFGPSWFLFDLCMKKERKNVKTVRVSGAKGKMKEI